jgi:ParB family chromosome partitioning protein
LIGDADNDPVRAKRTGLPDRLVEDLTAQKSAAIGAELVGQPEIALAAVVHCLAIRSFYPGCAAASCLELFPKSFLLQGSLSAPDACKGLTAIEQERDHIADRLPGNPEDLWSWCLERSRDELLDLLAIIAARTVNAVQRKGDRPDAYRLTHANDLAKALKLDIGAWFTPTAEGYFNRVSRSQILAAINEAKGDHAPALDKLKKSELAVRAESLVAGTGWLPEPLRTARPEALSQAVE